MVEGSDSDDKGMVEFPESMSETELRHFFKLMKETHAQALQEALDILHGNDGTTTTKATTAETAEDETDTETDVDAKKKKKKKLGFGRIFQKKKDKDDGHQKSTATTPAPTTTTPETIVKEVQNAESQVNDSELTADEKNEIEEEKPRPQPQSAPDPEEVPLTVIDDDDDDNDNDNDNDNDKDKDEAVPSTDTEIQSQTDVAESAVVTNTTEETMLNPEDDDVVPTTEETTETSPPENDETTPPTTDDVAKSTEESSPETEAKASPVVYVPGEVPGCYLVYDSGSSGRLMLYYSEDFVPESVGFWSPGPDHTIQKFKFSRDSGRSILIGNCASGVQGRHNYYSGWCQFYRQARQMEGSLTVFVHKEGRGLPVDMYAFYLRLENSSNTTVPIQENVPFPTAGTDAVCCLPKHSTIFDERVSLRVDNWMTITNKTGAATGFYEKNTSSSGGGATTVPAATPSRARPSPADNRAAASPSPSPSSCPDVGCYLVYDRDGARLMAHYSRTPVSGAVGFWRPGPGKSIQPFKFKQNQGRSVVQSDCASGVSGRRNYYSGWCQFVRSARLSNGLVTLFPRRTDDPDCPQQHGLDVDLFVYRNDPPPGATQTQHVLENVTFDTNGMTALACLPRRADFFEDNVSVNLDYWMTTANKAGSATRFDAQT